MRHLWLPIALAAVLVAAVPAGAQEPAAVVNLSPVSLIPNTTASVHLDLRLAGGYRATFGGTVPTDARGRVAGLPLGSATYQLCRGKGHCETHPLFPGLRLEGRASASTGPVRGRGPKGEVIETSAMVVQRVTGMVGVVPGVRPWVLRRSATRRPARVRTSSGHRVVKLRWKRWGRATARAVGRSNGRRAVVRATEIVDCGGRLYYSALRARTRRGGSEPVAVRVPCRAGGPPVQQVYPG